MDLKKLGITARPLPQNLKHWLEAVAKPGGDTGMAPLSPRNARRILGALEYERQRGDFGDSVRKALPRIPKKTVAAMYEAGRERRAGLPLPDPEVLGQAIGKALAVVLVKHMGVKPQVQRRTGGRRG